MYMTEVTPEEEREDISVKSLLAAGAHYGHVTSAWCPKMAPYLYGSKSVTNKRRRTKNVYIFNLDLTMKLWERARDIIVENAAAGGSLLFVGTKPQSRDIIRTEAQRCSSPFVDYKWVGGLLTNNKTVRQALTRMKEIQNLLDLRLDPESKVNFTKKEALLMTRELEKLNRKFGGVKNMIGMPDMMFVIDTVNNHLAIEEAHNLGIPVIAITDSNADPDAVDYMIPANDDAIGALKLIVSNVAEAVLEGKDQLAESCIIQEQSFLQEEYDFSKGERGAILDKDGDILKHPPGRSDPQLSEAPSVQPDVPVEYK